MSATTPPQRDRGQLVLVAALALALVLVALGVAFLQLGYDDDSERTLQDPTTQLERALDQAVYNTTAGTPAAYTWTNRASAVAAIDTNLTATTERLETSRLSDGHAYRIERNATRATQWTRANCPAGPDRQFGDCVAIDGIALQDRNGQTHVLGVAFDIEITTPDGVTRLTLVIERGTRAGQSP